MRRTIIFSVFLALALLAYALIPREGDQQAHEELFRVTGISKETALLEKKPCTHILKKNVLKEGWIGERYLRISAPRSELYILADEKDAIEELEDVKASLSREALKRAATSAGTNSGNTFNVRTFEGERARFYYKTRALYGTKVHFSDYTLQNAETLESLEKKQPEISGIAERVAFALKENNIDVNAYGIEADFNTQIAPP